MDTDCVRTIGTKPLKLGFRPNSERKRGSHRNPDFSGFFAFWTCFQSYRLRKQWADVLGRHRENRMRFTGKSAQSAFLRDRHERARWVMDVRPR